MKKRTFAFGFSALAFTFLATSASAADAFSRKYADIEQQLQDLAMKYPRNAAIVDVGTNDTGQMIRALKAGNGPVSNVIVATHHGNEYGSTEVALATAASLAENPIPGQTVYVIPVLNTSGYDYRERRERGKDPNRDYPGPCGTDGPFRLKSTKALADFIAAKNIVVSATLHTHSPAVLYPWGFYTEDLSTEYDQLYKDLGKAATIDSKYPVGNSAELIYPANGCYEDYVFWKHGTWSLLFEMGTTHRPSQKAIDELVRVNVPGLRRYLETAPRQRAEKHAFTGECAKKGIFTRQREDE